LTKHIINVIITIIIKEINFGDFIVKMINNSINGDMMRGHIDTIILLSLVDEDKHTNEIRDIIEAKAGGKYKVKQGTFYSALQRLAKQGYVSEYRASTSDSIRRKYFHLTEKGKIFVEENKNKWNYSKSILDDLINESTPEKENEVEVSPILDNQESDFDELLKNSDNFDDFVTKTETEGLDDYFSQLNSTLQSELESLNTVEENILDDSVAQDQIDEEFLLDEEQEFIENIAENETLIEIPEENDNDCENNFDPLQEDIQENVEKDNIIDDEQTQSTFNSDFSFDNFDEEIEISDNTLDLNLETNNDLFDLDNEILEENTINGDNIFELNENLVDNEVINDSSNDYVDEFDSLLQENLAINEEVLEEIETNNEAEIDITETINEDNDLIYSNDFINSTEEENNDVILENDTEETILDTILIDDNEPTINNEDVEIENNFEEVPDNSYATDEKYLFGKDENKELYSKLLDNLFNTNFNDNAKEEVFYEEQEPDKSNLEEKNSDNFESLVNSNKYEPPIDFNEKEVNSEPKISFKDDCVQEKKLDVNNYKVSKDKYNSSQKIDYGDIIKYAQEEGFKVRTSFTTNKAEIGKVLVNKLCFHTALLFFFITMIELSILFFVFKTSYSLNKNFYIFSAIIIFSILFFNTLIYILNKNKAISTLSTFKDSIEVVFIICLNLILLICAFAIISDINFNLIDDLVKYIIIPFIFVLNIPVFYFIKYLLLEKNIYYTK